MLYQKATHGDLDPFYKHVLTLIPAWMAPIKKCRMNLLIYTQISKVAPVEVWEWISDFIPHFTRQNVTFPCRD